MAVITISRQYGSRGNLISPKVAEVLGYDHVDKELINEVAQMAKVSKWEVEKFDERKESSVKRFLRKLIIPENPRHISTLPIWESSFHNYIPEQILLPQNVDFSQEPSVLDYDRCLKFVQSTIRHLWSRGNIVIVGRGSQIILADTSDVLHVRVIAPLDYRCQVVMEEEKVDKDTALALIGKNDKRQADYIKQSYRTDWSDPSLYHITLNSEKMGIDAAAELIASAAKQTEGGGRRAEFKS